jgi:hypothetical protein
MPEGSIKERFRQSDGAYMVALVVFLSIWRWRTSGQLSLSTVLTFAAFSWMALVYGDFFLRITSFAPKLARASSFRCLIGYFLLNSSLAILTLASALGMVASFLFLAAGAVVVRCVLARKLEPKPVVAEVCPDLLCIVISGIAATLWSADALSPPLIDGQNVTFRIWQDGFIHMKFISSFSQARGLWSISDVEMAGAPLTIYHYASYFIPAALMSLTQGSALDVFAGFQLPFGILLSGLAAFAFASSLWGFWPGLAACCALLLLPDSYEQGFGNRYLSYNFLQQVNVGGLYGVSCLAVAWIFILDGCRSGKYVSIIVGYAFILLTGFYKAQFFVASAFPALMYPCIFFTSISGRLRAIVAIVFVAIFSVIVWFSQQFEAVPTLRLDFSSVGAYAVELINAFDPGVVRTFFGSHVLPKQSKIIVGLYVAGMIFISSFGVWGIAFGLMTAFRKNKLDPAVLFFPLMLVANYLVMALGTAADSRAIGTWDELLNRPVVWAYFGVVAWTAGATYAWLFGDDLPERGASRYVVGLLAISCFSVPWFFGRDLQTFPARPGFGSFAEFSGFPACLVDAADYIRRHSRTNDVIQDSTNDKNLMVGALSERQDFAVDVGVASNRNPQGIEERLDGLVSFKLLSNEADVMSFAAKNKIAWYLLRPETTVSWPFELRERFAFDCGGYRVYQFPE